MEEAQTHVIYYTFEAPYINFPKNMVLSERLKKPYEIGGGDEFITQGPG